MVNTAGYLVTKDGDYVLNQNGAMNADAGARIQVDPNVPITVDEKGKYGENMYDLVNGGARQASTAKVTQGCIESSNINVVSEMVNMITISRAFQAGQKVINAVDETLDKAVNQVGKV